MLVRPGMAWWIGVVLVAVIAGSPGATAGERVADDVPACVDDSWEYDDECPGSEIRPGAAQRRRLCDEDWAYFAFDGGARYRIETRRLRGGADTEIELWMEGDYGCVGPLAADDDGGSGRASRIELDAPPGGLGSSYATVVVRQAGGVYADGMEYELSVERLRRSYAVPVVAHANGVGGTRYRSDLRLANPTAEAIDVELVFSPTGAAGPDHRIVRTVGIGGGATAVFDDLVATVFGVQGVGAVLVHTPGVDLLGGSTIRIATDAGNYRQEVPLVPVESAQHERLRVFPLVNAAGSRTNVGFAAVLGGDVTLEIEVWEADWSGVVADRTVTVPALGHLQFNRVFERLGLADREGVYQLVTRRIEGGSVVAYASTVDRSTGDAWLATGFDSEHVDARRGRFVPVGAGDGGSIDLAVAANDAGRMSLRFLPEPGGGDPMLLNVDLDVGVNILGDVRALLGLTAPGVLSLPDPSSPVIVRAGWTRNGGEVGFSTVGIARDERASLFPDPPWSGRGPRLEATGADGSPGHRTSLGWVNPTHAAGRAEVVARTATGGALGSTSIALEPLRAGSIEDVFAAVGTAGRRDAALEVEVVAGDAAVLAWIVVTDLATGDATFEAARPPDEGWPRVHTVNLEQGAFELGEAPQAAAIDRLPVEEFRATATATGDLGRPDLPVHAACSYVDSDGEIRAAGLGDGDVVEGIGGLSPFTCVVPDWIDCSDNRGGVRITLTGGPHTIRLDLDARDHCLQLDTVPEAFVEVAPAPAYSLRVVEYAPKKLPVLVLYRDGATGELDVTALDDGDVVAPVAPFQLIGLVLDVDHVSRRVGLLSLYPLPRAPAAR